MVNNRQTCWNVGRCWLITIYHHYNQDRNNHNENQHVGYEYHIPRCCYCLLCWNLIEALTVPPSRRWVRSGMPQPSYRGGRIHLTVAAGVPYSLPMPTLQFGRLIHWGKVSSCKSAGCWMISPICAAPQVMQLEPMCGFRVGSTSWWKYWW